MSQVAEAPAFAGFDPAHTTPIPNELIDELLTVLSWDELKVFLYIARRTKGFNKESDTISLAQFTDGITTKDGRKLDNGCGIKNRARVVDARDSLRKRGYIKFEQVTRGNSYGATVYSICYQGSDATVPTPSDATVPTPSDATVPTPSDATVPTPSDATVPHNIQLTKDSKQNTERQSNIVASATTPARAVSSSKKSTSGETALPTKKARPKKEAPQIMLSAEEQTVYDLYCHLWFVEVKPKVTEGVKRYCATLAPHIKTQEEMNSLEQFTRKRLQHMNISQKVVQLGNLVNQGLNGWLQTRPKPATPQVATKTGLTEGEARQLARNAVQMASTKDHEITVTPKQLETGAWAITVDWQTEWLEPMTIKTREHWNIALDEICTIWKSERKSVTING